VKKALKIFDDDESQKNGLKILEKLSLLSKGDIDATLIIEDPFGQSNIMDIDVKKEKLTEDELKNLKTGFTIFEGN
jgi:zinc finger protein